MHLPSLARLIFAPVFCMIAWAAIAPLHSVAQDPTRFEQEVEALRQAEHRFDEEQPRVVFTGSSSVRMWTDVQARFPEYNVINTGFGGSQMSDLLYYLDDLVLRYEPDVVFIYEGDNDIAAGKRPDSILATTEQVVARIDEALPDAEVYLISPKPSLARWALRDQYEAVNARLSAYADTTAGVRFVDVWTPMLNERGRPLAHIFIEDGLHMNEAGYEIWSEVIGAALRN